jgi:hypothetical protein
MALTQVPPALLTATTGTGSTVVLSASPTFTGTVTTPSVTFSDASSQSAAASPYVLKNRIINGDMRIDQRNAGASVTPANGAYTLDRWIVGATQASKFTIQQNAGSVTPPTGFSNYLGITSSSAYSVISTDEFEVFQRIEGFNTSDLAWGTANAKTVTLSFWVRSSLTGTFGGSLFNSATNRSYVFSYTISAANTWEQKSITIAGDTSGTWVGATNGTGIAVLFNIGAGASATATAGAWNNAFFVAPTGQTSVVGTNGATWYVTGVQLEQNTSATPFERRLYNQELANCQRYCQRWTGNGVSTQAIIAMGMQTSTTTSVFNVQTAVPMRATPTITFSSLIVSDSIGFDAAASIVGIDAYASTSSYVGVTHASAGASNRPVRLSPGAASTGFFNFSAEL